MKKILAGAFCLFTVFATNTAFADLRVLGQGGYLSLTAKEEDPDLGEKLKYTGVGASLRLQYDVLSPIPGFSLFAGTGLGYLIPTYEEKIQGIKVKVAYTEQYIPIEVGAQFSAIPLLRFQVSGQYHYGIGGEISGEIGDTEFPSQDLKSSNRIMLTGRAMMTVAPFVSAGLYADYLVSGETKFEDQDDAMKFGSGYEVGAVAALNF